MNRRSILKSIAGTSLILTAPAIKASDGKFRAGGYNSWMPVLGSEQTKIGQIHVLSFHNTETRHVFVDREFETLNTKGFEVADQLGISRASVNIVGGDFMERMPIRPIPGQF